MAIQIWQNCKIYVAEFDMSGYLNAVALDYSVEILDGTVYGNTTRTRVGGLKDVSMSFNGFWEAAQPDETFYTELGLGGSVVTICPTDGSTGEVAYFWKPMQATYAPGGEVGQLMEFSVTSQASALDSTNRLIRGTVMAPKASRTSNDSGTAYQLGAVSAAQKVYAGLHIFTVSGTNPTLDVIVKSDDNQPMASPTTRITFTQATAVGNQWKTQDGAITDDWWQVSWTIGGTDTPTFNFAVVVGIL
jgi:hypothetical protein